MNVAKTYIGWETIGDAFVENRKMYIYAINPKTETKRKIRVYSDYEYEKLYPDLANKKENKVKFKTQKEVLGFVDGYITIFKGNTYAYKDWFKENGATYTRHWGWSFASTAEIPEEMPSEITPVKLNWNLVGSEETETLYNDETVKEKVESLIYDAGNSSFKGTVGERLDLEVTVKKTLSLEGYYGASTMHIMEDDEENIYVWTTSSKKTFEEGSHIHIKGTVKDHKVYRNQNQTVLTRCTEVK